MREPVSSGRFNFDRGATNESIDGSLPQAFPGLEEKFQRLGRSFGREKSALRIELAELMKEESPESRYILDRHLDNLGRREGPGPSSGDVYAVLWCTLAYYGTPEWIIETLKDKARIVSDEDHPEREIHAARLISSVPARGRFDATVALWEEELQSGNPSRIRAAATAAGAQFESYSLRGEPGEAEEILNRICPKLVSLALHHQGHDHDIVAATSVVVLRGFAMHATGQFCRVMMETAADKPDVETLGILQVFGVSSAGIELGTHLVELLFGGHLNGQRSAVIMASLEYGAGMIPPLTEKFREPGMPTGAHVRFLRQYLPMFGPDAVDMLLPLIEQEDDASLRETALLFTALLASAPPTHGDIEGEDYSLLWSRLKEDDVGDCLSKIADAETMAGQYATAVLQARENNIPLLVEYSDDSVDPRMN